MKNRVWGLIFMPLMFGLVVMLLIQVLLQPLPLVEFKADLGTVYFLLGALITLFLLVWGLTRLRQMQDCQKILRSERSQQQDQHRRFLRRLDHQLKNPLTALRAALVNLTDQTEPESRSALQDATTQADRLSRLVGDLRKLAELEERPLEKVKVDLPELLVELIEAAQDLPVHRSRKINLVVSRVPWPPPPVLGDPDLLGLAFYNLLENALKYSTPEDAVEVRVLEDDHFLIVEVADAGQGIDPEDLPHLFEELFRGVNAHGLEGSGLGLALVERLVQLHGGEISVRSRRKDQKGTVFVVRLPLAKST
jgi:two-component system, OmpR family, sensor kinase